MPSTRKLLKWLGIGLAGPLAIAAGGLGLGYAWLRSDSGGDWLARQIEQAVGTPGEIELSIGRLEGKLPAELSLSDIVARDAQGTWLTASAVDLRWRPWDLLSGTLKIDALTIGKVGLTRLPATPAEDPEDQGTVDANDEPLRLPVKIRVRQFTAEEIALEEAVLGQAARFTLTGNATGEEDGSLTAGLELRRLDGAEAHLLAQMEFDPAGDQLTAKIDASEAPGGLLSALLELPDLPRTDLQLAGGGPLADWHGDFKLSLGEVAQAEAAIALTRRGADELIFRVDGHGDLDPPGDAPAFALLRGRTTIDLAGSWQEAGRLQIERFAAAGPVLALETQGSFEPDSGALDVTLKARALDAMPLAGLLDLDRLERLDAELAVTGSLERPQARIDLQAGPFAAPGFEAAGARLGGLVSADDGITGPAPRLALDLNGQVEAPRLVGEDEVNAVLGESIPWALRGGLNSDSLTLDITEMKAELETAALTASGPFDLQKGAAQLQAALAVPDLKRLQPLTDIALGGRVELAGPIRLAGFGSRLEADLKGRWAQPASDIGVVAALAGKGMELALQLAVDGATVNLPSLKARSQVAELTGAMTLHPDPAALDGRYSLALPDAAALAGELAADISGPARIEGSLTGPPQALQLAGMLQVQQLIVAEQRLRDLEGGYRLALRGSDIDGPVTLALASPFGPAEVEGDLKVRQSEVTLAALQARVAETRLQGEVVVPLEGGLPMVSLDGEIGSLSPWLTAGGLGGDGRGSVSLKLNLPGAAAPLLATADLTRLAVVLQPGGAAISAERLTLDLQAEDAALSKNASFKLRGQGVTRDNLSLERLDLEGQGGLQDLEVKLAATGAWVEALELQAAARLRHSDTGTFVTLRQAEGRAFGQPLSLRRPAELSLTPTETRLENLDLASGGTSLTADALLDGDRITVKAALDALPMTTVDAFWKSGLDGMVSAELDLEGPVSAPRGTASLTASNLAPRGAKKLPPLELTTKADWQNGRVKLEGQLGGAQLAAARFSADAPLQLTADGTALEIPDTGALSGQATWSGDASTLLLFVPLPQHRLKGQTEVALDIAGTVGKPRLDGGITMRDGRYENLDSGTVLRKLDLEVEIAEERVTLARLSASDGAKGKLSGQGSLLLDVDKGLPLELAIALEQFRALERDEVTAVIGGSVKIDGTANAPNIEGRLTTETVEVSLATNLPPNVVSLDVIEIKDDKVQEEAKEPETAAAVVAALDIVIDMPRRVFVRGRGLDSEWAGRIQVAGTSAEPQVSGELNIVRGQMSVVGKVFKLSEGTVTLPASLDSDPLLDVTAEHKGKELAVTARLSGPVTQPELELSSVPDVPRDEIISRVLFNKSAAQLSAAEAAQLALALRDLTGNGSGSDILGFARRTMGVDVLRVDTSEDGGASVEAGKYLTDEVYVGVKQGATSQSSGAAVEVELTPNITVETEVTGSGGNKSGVRFQLDY